MSYICEQVNNDSNMNIDKYAMLQHANTPPSDLAATHISCSAMNT